MNLIALKAISAYSTISTGVLLLMMITFHNYIKS